MAKLFFFGDSITAGAWDERGGWVSRLIGQVMAMNIDGHGKEGADKDDFYCFPYNLGVSGDTAPDIVRRFDKEVLARIYGADPEETVQFVFAIGVNDSVLHSEDRSNFYSDEAFIADIQAIIAKARKISDNISFIGPMPVHEEILNPIPWATGKIYTNQSVQHFNEMIKMTCAEHGVAFLNLYDLWIAMEDYTSYFIDGVHPNAKGHALLAQQIGDFLLTDAFKAFHS